MWDEANDMRSEGAGSTAYTEMVWYQTAIMAWSKMYNRMLTIVISSQYDYSMSKVLL